MNLSRKHSALLLALGLVLVATPIAPAAHSQALPIAPRISLDVLLNATARSTSDKQAIEALVAGLRDTVRFLKQKPRPAFLALVKLRPDKPWRIELDRGVEEIESDDTHRLVALIDGRLNLPPPMN